MGDSRRRLRAVWLGQRPYQPVLELQARLVQARQAGTLGDVVLLLEHDAVITAGRRADPNHQLVSSDALRERGIELFQTERGGDYTYHGPGQLVAYPIVDLAPDRCDVRRYVSVLLQTMMSLASDFGIGAGTLDDHVGVWVDRASVTQWPGPARATRPAKIGAVGVRIARWVTMHGFAFNSAPDLDGFSVIVPCGIRNLGVTSVEQLRGGAPSPSQIALRAAELLCGKLDADLVSYSSICGSWDSVLDHLLPSRS